MRIEGSKVLAAGFPYASEHKASTTTPSDPKGAAPTQHRDCHKKSTKTFHKGKPFAHSLTSAFKLNCSQAHILQVDTCKRLGPSLLVVRVGDNDSNSSARFLSGTSTSTLDVIASREDAVFK